MESFALPNGESVLEGSSLLDSREFDFDAFLLELERQCRPEAETETKESAVHAQDRSLSASPSSHDQAPTIADPGNNHTPLLANSQTVDLTLLPTKSALPLPGEDYLNQLLYFVQNPQLPPDLGLTVTSPLVTIPDLAAPAAPLPLVNSLAAQQTTVTSQSLVLNPAAHHFPLPVTQQLVTPLHVTTDTHHLFFEPGQLPIVPRATSLPNTLHPRTKRHSDRSHPYNRPVHPSDSYLGRGQTATIAQEQVYQPQDQQYQQQVERYLKARYQQLQQIQRATQVGAVQPTAVPPHLLPLDATGSQQSTPAVSRASSLPPLNRATTVAATPIPTPSSSRSRSRESEPLVDPQSVRGPTARRRMKRQLNKHIRKHDPYKKKLDNMAEIDEKVAARRKIWLENGYKNADFSCIIEGCDEYSIDAQTWSRHCQSHGPKRAKCEFCGKMYSRDCGRIRHLARGCPMAP